jgi:hypothetical protein
MTLLDIYVPWKTRVKESHEWCRGLKDELGKVNVIMVPLKITEFNVFEPERVVSQIVVDRWLVWDVK